MSGAVLDLDRICVRRSGRMILRDVSCTIPAGGHWALLGANGSGKTTLLKVICGYEWPTSGSVEVLGQRFGACDIPRLRRSIGWASSFLVQRFPPDVDPLTIVATGIDAALAPHREYDDAEYQRAYDALGRVGGAELYDKPYAVLSQGERQRVVLARALVNDPPLLILDEPCAGLDPASRERFLDEVEDFAARPGAPTLLLVTHHLEELRPLFGSALLLKDGRVIGQGARERALAPAALRAAFGMVYEVESSASGYRVSVRRE